MIWKIWRTPNQAAKEYRVDVGCKHQIGYEDEAEYEENTKSINVRNPFYNCHILGSADLFLIRY